jgi:hypothetical protein
METTYLVILILVFVVVGAMSLGVLAKLFEDRQ